MFDLNQEFEKMAPNPVPEIQRKITRKIKFKLLFTKLSLLSLSRLQFNDGCASITRLGRSRSTAL